MREAGVCWRRGEIFGISGDISVLPVMPEDQWAEVLKLRVISRGANMYR